MSNAVTHVTERLQHAPSDHFIDTADQLCYRSTYPIIVSIVMFGRLDPWLLTKFDSP